MSLLNNSTQQTSRTKDDIPALKIKAAELERQANEFKTKLDELRRAKATTVLKFEKEYVNTAAPGTNRPEKIKCDKCDEIEQLIETEKKSNLQLKKQNELKDTNKKQSSSTAAPTSGPCSKCPTSQELLDNQKENNIELTQQVIDQEKQTDNERKAKEMIERKLAMTQSQLLEIKHRCEKLQKENQDYQNLFEKMKKEYDDKLAELSRQEEEAKKQVATWEQMYTEWMSNMEKRVHTLQTTNQQLNDQWFQDDNERSPHRRPGGTGNQRR